MPFPRHLLYLLRMTRILSEFKFCRSQHRKIMCSIIWLSGVCCFVNIAACSLFHFLHAHHNYHLSDTLMSNSGVYNHSLLILYQIYIILECRSIVTASQKQNQIIFSLTFRHGSQFTIAAPVVAHIVAIVTQYWSMIPDTFSVHYLWCHVCRALFH